MVENSLRTYYNLTKKGEKIAEFVHQMVDILG